VTEKQDQEEKAQIVEEELEDQEEETAAEEGDKFEKLQEQLEQAEAQAAEYLDGWQRTQAEFSNYKKRQEAERGRMTTLANMAMLSKLLPIVDDFERALATLPSDLSQLTWCEGVLLIKAKLDSILQSEGVEVIDTEGQTFDPRYHEAVTHEEVEGYEEGDIIDEVQKGYMLGERVLRPALVRVAKASAPQPDQSEEDNDTKE